MNASRPLPDAQGGFDVLGTWWHFDRYEIRGGALRPAPGATLQAYDPWARYAEARSGWGNAGGTAPYERLLDLLWSLRLAPTYGTAAPLQLMPESEQALVGWCAEHGLLGVLPHETELATLAPRWEPVARFELAGIPLAITRRSYQWGYGGWQIVVDSWWRTHTRALEKARKQRGELVPRALALDEWGAPSVLRRALADASWATTPIEHAWAPFFPDVAERARRDHAYPVPLSEAFWQAYAEPVDTFVRAADLLYQALVTLGDPDASDKFDFDLDHPRGQAHRALFSLLDGCTPALARDPQGKHRRAFHAKSLLASLAMMAYLDLTSGWRVLQCDEDGRPFVSRAYQAR